MKTVCARRRCCLASRPRLKTKRVGLMCSAAPFESSPAGMACRRPGTDQAGTAGRGRTPRRPRRAASRARWRNRGNWPRGSAYAIVLLAVCIGFVMLMMRVFRVSIGAIGR